LNPLFKIIADEIRKGGLISFARFMELALYCPVYGFYEKEKDNLGRRGDFFTSVSTGNLFGQLLAFQFADWLKQMLMSRPRHSHVHIVEAGAHNGQLAKDILTWLQRTELFDRIQYCIVEPSPRRQLWQKENLSGLQGRIRWVGSLDELAGASSSGIEGIIFSNELLDAMPVQRFAWDAANRTWFEWGVALEGERFAWKKIAAAPAPWGADIPGDLLDVLPDGFIVERSLAADAWWAAAARILNRGKLLTIDYGLSGEELLSPERSHGTLRSYFRHHAGADVLSNVGDQDITAHVNFTAIQHAGEAAGLQTEALCTQERFLTQIAELAWKGPAAFGEWNSASTRQFQTLTHPEHLGRVFRVLVQSRQHPDSPVGKWITA
jgi:SAM-dependent MidA family methyltransferase